MDGVLTSENLSQQYLSINAVFPTFEAPKTMIFITTVSLSIWFIISRGEAAL
jgi:hypothetical protein